MRVTKWFCLFTLVGFAAGLSAAAPAGAQGTGSDSGGSSATLSRTEGGSIVPSAAPAPAALEPFWTSVQVVFARHRFPIWTRAKELGAGSAAWLPPRKRAAR
jgi:hypothetical protein